MESLSGLDAAFLAAETDTMPLNVGGILVLDKGKLSEIESYDRILRLFAARIHQIPHFRKKVVNAPFGLVQPHWVEDLAFSLSSHIHLAFPNEEVGFAQVYEFAASVLGERLDRSRPLWDLFVIPRVTKNRLAVIAKLHHALTDGISGMEALASMFDLTEAFDPDIQPEAHAPDGPPSQVEVATRTVMDLAEHALSSVSSGLTAVRELPNALSGSSTETALKMAGDLMLRPKRTGATGSISASRKIVADCFELDEVKSVARSYGVKVNDVLLTLSHGAFVAYLKAHGLDLPDRLIVMVPVSVHQESGGLSSKNKVSALFLTIPTEYDDPKALLMEIHEITERAKAIHVGIGSMFFYNLAEVIPPVLLETVFRAVSKTEMFKVVPPPFNYVVSNIPGPNVDLFMAGNRLEQVIPLAPVADGSGITFAYLSYKGAISLGLVVDPELFTHADEFHELITKILRDLLTIG